MYQAPTRWSSHAPPSRPFMKRRRRLPRVAWLHMGCHGRVKIVEDEGAWEMVLPGVHNLAVEVFGGHRGDQAFKQPTVIRITIETQEHPSRCRISAPSIGESRNDL